MLQTTSNHSSQDTNKRIIFKLNSIAKQALMYCIKQKSDSIINPPQEIVDGAYLLEQRGLVQISIQKHKYVVLDTLGEEFLQNEMPEYQLLQELKTGEKKRRAEITLTQDIITSALGELKKKQLIEISKENGELSFQATGDYEQFLRSYSNPLLVFKSKKKVDELSKNESTICEELQKRKGFVKTLHETSIHIQLTELGKAVGEELIKHYSNLELEERVSSQMLQKKKFKDVTFRHYDIDIPTTIDNIGRLHPMHEANDILSQIFLELGFQEMEGPIVESEFWCFDALWIPQDHPAREDQDTFYVGGRADVDEDLLKSVEEMHERGIDSTHTQEGEFNRDVSRNTILRTHSTSTTFRTLHKLGQKAQRGENIDGKYFYVAHNFRNEAVDATHLAEFFQAEGILIADDLSLAGLIGFMKEFYAKLGLHQLKFKPTFNPYTEPSMEIHYFDSQMNKWYSIGNSGIFRPETLKSFGLENKRIYGFGLGASRVATLLTGKNNMREITGATCDLEWIKTHKTLRRNILR
ncbi:MAG: phenylalanine--tRNA ligase subunit alpha [Candidatus Nanoarchaeia archaeon]